MASTVQHGPARRNCHAYFVPVQRNALRCESMSARCLAAPGTHAFALPLRTAQGLLPFCWLLQLLPQVLAVEVPKYNVSLASVVSSTSFGA